MRIRKNPEKSGFLRIFLFTPGLPILYHLVANAGLERFHEARGHASRTGESEQKEHYGSNKDDAIAIDQRAGGSGRSAEQSGEGVHRRLRRTGDQGNEEE